MIKKRCTAYAAIVGSALLSQVPIIWAQQQPNAPTQININLQNVTIAKDTDLDVYVQTFLQWVDDKREAEALDLLDRTIATWQKRPEANQQPPANPAADGKPTVSRWQMRAWTLEVLRLDIQHALHKIDDKIFLERLAAIFETAKGHEDRLIGQWSQWSEKHTSQETLKLIISSAPPVSARNLLYQWIYTYYRPLYPESPADFVNWYDQHLSSVQSYYMAPGAVGLFARTMDKAGYAKEADEALERWLNQYPDSDIGVMALQLRLHSLEKEEERSAFIEQYFKKYRDKAIGKALASNYARKQIEKQNTIGGIQAVVQTMGPTLMAAGDGAKPEDLLYEAIDWTSIDNFPLGMGRGPKTTQVTPATPSTLAISMSLFKEYLAKVEKPDESVNWLTQQLSVNGKTPESTLAETLQYAAEDASKLKAKDGLLPDVLAARLTLHHILRQRVKSLPSTAERVLLTAYINECCGKGAEAEKTYQQIIQNGPTSHEAVFARLALLQILPEKSGSDITAVDTLFDEYLKNGGYLLTDTQSLWVLQRNIRLLTSTAADQRKTIWQTQFDLLRNRGLIGTSAMADTLIDTITRADGKNLPAMRMLTDLLLICPTSELMYKLQSARINLLVQDKQWTEALCASRLQIVLSFGTASGPTSAVEMHNQIAAKSGTNAAELAQWRDPATWLGLTDSGAAVFSAGTAFGDEMLCKIAQASLEQPAEAGSADNLALVRLIAGQNQAAAVLAFERLRSSPSSLADPEAVNRALATTTAVGSPSGFSTMINWLANPTTAVPSWIGDDLSITSTGNSDSKITPAQWDILDHQWRDRIIQWAQKAITSRQNAWAEAYGLLALANCSTTKEFQRVLDGLAKNYIDANPDQSSVSATRAADPLRRIQTRLSKDSEKCLVQLKIASLFYEASQFEKCISEVKQIQTWAKEPAEQHDLAVGSLEALSLIRLQRYDDALVLLKSMDQWPGEVEEHGRAAFLVGWIYLQQGHRAEAIEALTAMRSKYGKSSFAAKAQDLIKRLQAE